MSLLPRTYSKIEGSHIPRKNFEVGVKSKPVEHNRTEPVKLKRLPEDEKKTNVVEPMESMMELIPKGKEYLFDIIEIKEIDEEPVEDLQDKPTSDEIEIIKIVEKPPKEEDKNKKNRRKSVLQVRKEFDEVKIPDKKPEKEKKVDLKKIAQKLTKDVKNEMKKIEKQPTKASEVEVEGKEKNLWIEILKAKEDLSDFLEMEEIEEQMQIVGTQPGKEEKISNRSEILKEKGMTDLVEKQPMEDKKIKISNSNEVMEDLIDLVEIEEIIEKSPMEEEEKISNKNKIVKENGLTDLVEKQPMKDKKISNINEVMKDLIDLVDMEETEDQMEIEEVNLEDEEKISIKNPTETGIIKVRDLSEILEIEEHPDEKKQKTRRKPVLKVRQVFDEILVLDEQPGEEGQENWKNAVLKAKEGPINFIRIVELEDQSGEEVKINLNDLFSKDGKTRRQYMYQLDPDDFSDKVMRSKIKRAKITYEHHQWKKQRIDYLESENLFLQEEIKKMEADLERMKDTCKCQAKNLIEKEDQSPMAMEVTDTFTVGAAAPPPPPPTPPPSRIKFMLAKGQSVDKPKRFAVLQIRNK